MYHIGRQWFLDLKMNPEKHFENNLGDNLEASTNIMLCHFSPRSSQSRKFGLLECSICLQNILGREPVSTKCGHTFCRACIRQSIQEYNRCPNCNIDANLLDLRPIYP